MLGVFLNALQLPHVRTKQTKLKKTPRGVMSEIPPDKDVPASFFNGGRNLRLAQLAEIFSRHGPEENLHLNRLDASPVSSNALRVVSDLNVKDDLPEVGISSEITLLDIDDSYETATMQLLIHTMYEDPTVYGNANAPDLFQRDDKYEGFIPVISLEPLVKTVYEEFHRVTRVNHYTGYVYTAFFNTVTLQQKFYYRTFPFDRQIISVKIQFYNARARKWGYRKDVSEDSTLLSALGEYKKDGYHDVTISPREWRLIHVTAFYIEDDDTDIGIEQGAIAVTFAVQRKPTFYLTSFCSIIFFIVAANASVVAVPTEDIGARISLSITLLLTLVAFKFVLMQGVPKVGYLTYMDKYFMVAFIAIMVAIMEHVGVSPVIIEKFGDRHMLEYEEEAAELDFQFQLYFSVTWIVFNAIVFVVFRSPRCIHTTMHEAMVKTLGSQRFKTFRMTGAIDIKDALQERK